MRPWAARGDARPPHFTKLSRNSAWVCRCPPVSCRTRESTSRPPATCEAAAEAESAALSGETHGIGVWPEGAVPAVSASGRAEAGSAAAAADQLSSRESLLPFVELAFGERTKHMG